ncbi:MAG: hypothetical protein GXY25_00055 [Pirellulaceae bacterium]|jgi:hypothetical protein|nr:hypothetical protein [Thermoguttaceae bacterium]MDI9446210.1 hypothetical protein [Planctomycetota bacterium]NLY98909.1 hypothetical protein [Pirellulaceae bacterium]
MRFPRSSRRVLASLATLAALTAWPAAGMAAEKLEQTSIRLIPEDAAFYGAMLRNGEQIKIIAESNAWAKLKNLPAVQMGLGAIEQQLASGDNPQAAQLKAMLENPQVKELLGLLGDMFSNDVFVYADPRVAPVVELLQGISNSISYGPLYFQASGQADAMSPNEMQAKAALYTLAENLDKIQIPTTVLGFAVEDEERAKLHLNKFEGLLAPLTFMLPQLAGRVVREKVGDDDFLAIKLDGKMIPWDEVPLDDIRQYEAREGDVDKLVEKITGLNLVIAFGVRHGYLMVACTDSLDGLARLGTGSSLLARPEISPLKKHAGKRLTGISYTSRNFLTQVAMSAEDIDGLLKIGDAALQQLPLDETQKGQIRKDVGDLAAELKTLIPAPGATLQFSFLSDRGIESYGYNWTEDKFIDASRPLDVLDFVGRDPILAVAWRGRIYPKAYDRIVHWVKVGHGYFEKYGVPEMSAKDRQTYSRLVEAMKPLCRELGRVNRESLIPALDGQCAIVLDAKLLSDKIAKDVPRTDEPMPLPEPALVVGIQDARAMRDAYLGYQEFFDKTLEVLRTFDERGEIPADYSIPWPEAAETAAGATLRVTLPEKWGVDPQIVPNAVLTEKVAVVTASEAHSKRLLEGQAPTAGLLADGRRPRALAVLFNWPALVDAAAPWVRLAARQVAKENLHVEDDAPEIENVVAQVDTVLEVLKAVRNCTAQSYIEDRAVVTHSLMEISDVP